MPARILVLEAQGDRELAIPVPDDLMEQLEQAAWAAQMDAAELVSVLIKGFLARRKSSRNTTRP